MRPDEIDATFVPRRRDEIATATLDHEAVIHDQARLFHLDPIATLVWECCDGTVSVDALASELSATFRVDANTTRRDVLRAVRALAADGLLDGIEGSPADSPLVHETPQVASPNADGCELEVRFDVGGLLLGVSTDHSGARDALRKILAAHVTDDPGEPAASYAISFADATAAGAPSARHTLYDQDGPLLETLDPRRALRALLTSLASHGDLASAGVGALPAWVIGRGDRAVLVAGAPELPLDGEVLERHGIAVADGTIAFVDDDGSVVIGAPGVEADLDALDHFAATLPSGNDAVTPLPWGRARVVALATDVADEPGHALLAFGPLADDDTPAFSGAERALDALLDLLATVPVVAAGSSQFLAAALLETYR